jgi:hypothetical protein
VIAMAQVDIEHFLPGVMTRAPSVPIAEAMASIRDAARTVCRRLKLWRHDDEIIITEPEYEAIYSPQDARISSIETASMGGVALKFRTLERLDDEHPGWRDIEPGSARFITQISPDTITVFPRQTGVIKLGMILVPSLDAETLPDFLLRDHADLIGWGAAGMLIAGTPNPEFFNAGLGSGLLAKFNAELDRIDAGAVRSQIRAPLRTRPRFF